MITIIGCVTNNAVICLDCGKNAGETEEMEPAIVAGYPDGFTCAECGLVVAG